ncbi:MAG: RNA-binding protein [Bacteroidales bacterium]|mgnify:CR=1 FL=1|jgi:RNA recognition motif-containing protein|nr:RNA-binding protein [Bacteroidales bacterium]MDD4258133.1 RNA-binding protein [Bacteroidales bacterium]
MNIYVSNLNFATKNDSLQDLFAQYGEVSSANIITDRETGRSRGFGFVEMPDNGEAQKAIDSLNNSEFEGKVIVVNEARPKTERSNDGGYHRGGGYNRGGGDGYNRGGNNRGGGGYNRNRY